MSLHSADLLQNNTLPASLKERAIQLCGVAKGHEEAGDYDAAQGAISEYWERVGEAPRLAGLDELARAEVLLRAGALSGWIGSSRQISGAQEIAKDLISQSAEIFNTLGLTERFTEARTDLAICYWREGAFDEARITLDDALEQLGKIESEQRLRIYLNKAIVEKVSNRYQEALSLHRQASPMFAASSNDALKGKFHNEFAQVLKNIGLAERREDYVDQALIEFSAASIHFEQAGHKRFQGRVENNQGFLFARIGRFEDAHNHLDRARSLFVSLKDKGSVAEVDDTRAITFLGQGRNAEAETVARRAVKVVEEGDEQSILAGILTTHGTALARLGRHQDALASLSRAIKVAEQAGAPYSGGIAALTIIEELGAVVPHSDLHRYYSRAESMLARPQYTEVQLRLGECARRILAGESSDDADFEPGFVIGNGFKQSVSLPAQTASSAEPWADSSLEQLVMNYEGELIRRALEGSGGSVTRAARLLGITHQGLAFIINGRHKTLLSARTPVKPRRRSIIRYR
ncbi:MAG: tetratricopeptide repeat protein [Acidobacteriota bacterium]